MRNVRQFFNLSSLISMSSSLSSEALAKAEARRAEEDPHSSFERKQFYAHRTPRSHSHHRDPGGNASSGIEPGETGGAENLLHQQSETIRSMDAELYFRLQRLVLLFR